MLTHSLKHYQMAALGSLLVPSTLTYNIMN